MSNITCEQYVKTIDEAKCPLKTEHFAEWCKGLKDVPKELKSDVWDDLLIKFASDFTYKLTYDKVETMKTQNTEKV